MTRHETACTLGGLLLAAAGTATVSHRMWWETWVFWGVAIFLAEGAIRGRRTRTRQARAAAERAERAARGPCCQIWKASEGAAHGADCTRPPAARATLRDGEQRILNQLADDTQDNA